MPAKCSVTSFGRCPSNREILSSVPFTLSHAAAAIPFRRTRLVMSALVMGCFAPDFAYFIYFTPHGAFGHSLAGVFILDLPASLLALWLFHAFVKQPLLLFLPSGVRRRLKDGGATSVSFWPLPHLGMVLLSILVGIATHIAWDFFTHDYDWPYRHWEFFRRPVHLPIAGVEPMVKLLEYGSSLLGLVVLAVWGWYWYRATEPSPSPVARPSSLPYKRFIVVLVPLLAISCGIFRAYPTCGVPFIPMPMFHFVVDSAIAAIGPFFLGLLLCGILLRAQSSRPEPILSS
jgi:Domain of unknown function (DUF4184)